MSRAQPAPEWMDEAVCASVDPDLFFVEEAHIADVATAKSVCRGCPVQRQCAAYALDHNLPGIWGGTTYRERLRSQGRLRQLRQAS